MKSTLVAALLVVLAIGCESGSLVKRDIPADVETLTKYVQDAIKEIKTHPLVSKAQDYLEESKAQITPLTDKIQEHADKIQEQIQPYITDIEGKVRPLAENIQTQLSPLTENLQAQVDKMQAKIKPLADDFQEQIEKLYQTMVEQTKALLPSQ